MKHEANGYGGDHVIALDGVEVQLFYSSVDDDQIVVQIDGAPKTREKLSVMINDDEIFNGIID